MRCIRIIMFSGVVSDSLKFQYLLLSTLLCVVTVSSVGAITKRVFCSVGCDHVPS